VTLAETHFVAPISWWYNLNQTSVTGVRYGSANGTIPYNHYHTIISFCSTGPDLD